MNISKKISFILLILAVLSLTFANYKQAVIDELNPVSGYDLELAENNSIELNFSIDRPERYYVWLDLNTADEKTLCNIITDSNLSCENSVTSFSTYYQIYLGDSLLKQETISPYSLTFSKKDNSSRLVLGEFIAPEKGDYTVEASMIGNLDILSSLEPNIKIGVHTLDYQSDIMSGAIAYLGFYFLLSLSGISFIFYIIFKFILK